MNRQLKHLYVFGPFRFDPEERLLLRAGRPVPLSPKLTETLFLLIQNAGHLVDKDELIRQVWPDAFVEDGNLNKNISVLRKTLGQWDGGREYIETVPKRGYRFVASVDQALETETISELDRATELPTGYGDTSSVSTIATNVAVARSKSRVLVLIAICLVFILGAFSVFRITRPDDPSVLHYSQITHDGQWKDELVTDGARIYFKLGTQGGYTLAQVSTVGGETAPISSPFQNFSLQDISSDGSELLILDEKDSLEEQPAYTLPLPSGMPRRLGEVIARAGAWSPDATQFAYGRDKDLYVAGRRGDAPRRLVTASGFVDTPPGLKGLRRRCNFRP